MVAGVGKRGVRASIVGSLPKPAWLAEPGILYSPWRVAAEQLAEAQEDAIRLCVADQLAAGLDVITDGEQWRRHYVWGFLSGITGVDTDDLVMKPTRGQRFKAESPAARLIAEPAYAASQAAGTLHLVRTLTDRPVKVTLPGPMTIVDSLADMTHRYSDADLAMIFADMLNREARALATAGAAVVQFDEPCFNIYLERTRDWGIEALKRAIAGVEAKTAIHICYGYGGSEVAAWKETNRDWTHYHHTLPLVAGTDVDQISIETAASRVDYDVLDVLRGKEVLLGLVNVGDERIESAEEVASGLRKAMKYIPAGSLLACTDCGLVLRSRTAALGKMKALAAGAAIVNAEIG